MMKAQQLRQKCSADERTYVDQHHKHKCDSCGTIWKHADNVPDACTKKQFETAHSCPSCGERQTNKFRTAQDRNDETEAFLDSLIADEED
jgi:predicted RNA-binding Zn-ribbon protein involved in translation (DUF1610 family)